MRKPTEQHPEPVMTYGALPNLVNVSVIRDGRAVLDTARDALGACFDYEEARIQTLPMKFACPSLVLRDGDTNSGATEVFQPWSEAVAEG